MLKAFRSARIFKRSGQWLISFPRIQRLAKSMAACFPIALKLGIIAFMVCYVFATIGMEVFNKDLIVHEESEYWSKQYTNFENIGSALLVLMHIINGSA